MHKTFPGLLIGITVLTGTVLPAYALDPITPEPIPSLPPVVYGDGINAFGGGDLAGLLLSGGPLLNLLTNGGDIQGMLPEVIKLALEKLPEGYDKYAGVLQGLLQGLLSGDGTGLGSLLSEYSDVISEMLGDKNLSGILGNLSPILSGILSGNFDIGSLLNAGIGILGNLFGGDNPIFGTISGLFGGLFGGSGSTISLSEPLSGVFSDPITAAISGQIFGGSSDTGGTTDGARTVLAQSGTILCLYNSDCIQSNPTVYRSLYETSVGALGFSSPNEVRGKIAELSKDGVLPDAFSTRFNSEQNADYLGKHTDREISRATTEQYLNKAGQEAQKKAIDAAQKTAQTLNALSDKCAKSARSSQDLIRCNMQINTAVPSFQAAQIALDTRAQIDHQFMKNLLGNISSATDGLNRQEDIERSSYSARLFHDATLTFPASGRK